MPASNDLKVDLRRSVADLRRLVYQIRHEVDVAGTQARKRWTAFLEPQLGKSEKLLRELAEVSRTAMRSTAAALDDFKGRHPAVATRKSRRAVDAKAASSSRGKRSLSHAGSPGR